MIWKDVDDVIEKYQEITNEKMKVTLWMRKQKTC